MSSDTMTGEQPPAIIDVDVQGDRVLATVDRGEMAVVVEGPVGISADEVQALLDDIPSKVETVTELFAGDDL